MAHTREAFGAAVDLDAVTEWSGLRPATPSSVPIIGASPLDNVFLNVGHGALGLTLAFGAAATLADKMNAL
ncbi:D-amino acid dehydrogenase small subunit [compost metagenome]